MTHALIQGAITGCVSYVICKATNISSPHEKAALVTILVGLRFLATDAINDSVNSKSRKNFFTCSSNLLTIPCALYVGGLFKFKVPDYLHLAGLTHISINITGVIGNLLAPYTRALL